MVNLKLLLPKQHVTRYSALLYDKSDKVVKKWTQLRPGKSSLRMRVPAATLVEGNYHVTLKSSSTNAQSSDPLEFDFTILRKE